MAKPAKTFAGSDREHRTHRSEAISKGTDAAGWPDSPDFALGGANVPKDVAGGRYKDDFSAAPRSTPLTRGATKVSKG